MVIRGTVIEYQLYFAKDLLNINKKRWFLLVYRLMKKRKEHFYFIFVVLLPQSICI